MPFAWCARPLFKNSKELDCFGEFSPLYKSDEKRLTESEIIKLLSDFRKPEKMNKLTVIPGSVSIKISQMGVTTPSKYHLFFLRILTKYIIKTKYSKLTK